MLAVGVVARLGYIVLVREPGRGGGDNEVGMEPAVFLVLVAQVVALLSLACNSSWATRAESAAT
jgi:hypothetical protein